MERFKVILISGCLLMLSGCLTTYHTVSFEVLEPAKITFPEDVRALLVMDRLPRAHNLMDSISLANFGGKDFNGFDTLISYNVFRGLYFHLNQSPVEPHQWPRWNRERQSDLLSAAGDRLTKKEVAELCYSNYADAIISLESCSLNISLKDTSYVPGALPEPCFTFRISSRWAIYLPAYPKPFHESAITDSIEYWPRGRRRSTLTDQIRQLSYRNGLHYGKIITPHWEQSERQIFSGGHPVLYRSAELTGKGDWDQAFSVWSDLASSGSKTNRAKAMYNMAVYYELEDRLDSAAVLLDRAVLLYQDDLIQNYQKEMHQRLQNRMTIRQQVERARLERLP